MSTPPLPNPGAPVEKKGKGPLFWILIGIGSLVMMGILMIGAVFFFANRAMQKAGVSLSDFQKNPGLAAARIAVKMNPDLEFVSENETDGSITVRQKSTGEIMTMRVDSNTGSFEMTDEKGRRFKVDGRSGQVQVEGDNGETAQFGANVDAKLPEWLPPYPGTEPKGTMAANTADGVSLSVMFKTEDSAQKVLDFYEQRLKGEGFTISNRTTLPTGGIMMAEDGAKKRTAVITMGDEGEVMIQTQENN